MRYTVSTLHKIAKRRGYNLKFGLLDSTAYLGKGNGKATYFWHAGFTAYKPHGTGMGPADGAEALFKVRHFSYWE